MASFERFDVVRVPFPFSDRQAQKHRPALVLSDKAEFNRPAGHSVMAMITSAVHSPWPLDVAINAAEAGLSASSKVRMKLFTLDNRLILHKAGTLSRTDQHAVSAVVGKLLAT